MHDRYTQDDVDNVEALMIQWLAADTDDRCRSEQILAFAIAAESYISHTNNIEQAYRNINAILHLARLAEEEEIEAKNSLLHLWDN